MRNVTYAWIYNNITYTYITIYDINNTNARDKLMLSLQLLSI